MNRIEVKKFFFLLILILIIILRCGDNQVERYLLTDKAKNVKAKKYDNYYISYSSNSLLEEEINHFNKIMGDWEKINVTGCDNKQYTYFKLINNKLIPFISYNISWRKGNQIAIVHFEEQYMLKDKPQLKIFFYTTEISPKAKILNYDEMNYDGKYYNLSIFFRNLKLIRCYAKSLKDENKNINYSDLINFYTEVYCSSDGFKFKDFKAIHISFWKEGRLLKWIYY